jgi:hypothetical protein
MVKRGHVWHCRNLLDQTHAVVGFVRFSYDGWDGYVMTGKKWPDAERWIDNRGGRKFWEARRAVEHAIRRERQEEGII